MLNSNRKKRADSQKVTKKVSCLASISLPAAMCNVTDKQLSDLQTSDSVFGHLISIRFRYKYIADW